MFWSVAFGRSGGILLCRLNMCGKQNLLHSEYEQCVDIVEEY